MATPITSFWACHPWHPCPRNNAPQFRLTTPASCGLDLVDDGQIDNDPRPAGGIAIDCATAAEEPGSLLNSLEPEASLPGHVARYADSPVLDLDLQATIALGQVDANPFALAVLTGVGQALLDDPVGRRFRGSSPTVQTRPCC